MEQLMVVVVAGDKARKAEHAKLVGEFRLRFGSDPQFVVCAPGRVNLIGEHIDYCGFGVLPFALAQDVCVACGLRDDGLVVADNTDSRSFPRAEFRASDPSFDFRATGPHWSNFVRAGLLSVMELAAAKGIAVAATARGWVGMSLLVCGAVPMGSGLSSSSALVVASALVCVRANAGKLLSDVTPEELATACASGERHVGTLGGGMDQAISVNAAEGCAMQIEFVPRLSLTRVPLPQGAMFVVANSLVVSSKVTTAERCYNKRVVECRLAAALLASKLFPDRARWDAVAKLHEVSDNAGVPLREMAKLVTKSIREGPFTIAEVAKVLGVSEEAVRKAHVVRRVAEEDGFELRNRALHVFTEAQRVRDFAELCKAPTETKIAELGKLMVQSHESCRDLYRCSCDELDEIVRICMSNGAAGARLTGAGWGGCAIALVDGQVAATRVMEALRKEYYAKKTTPLPADADLG
jgi:N-acetylgalactosamine kinase